MLSMILCLHAGLQDPSYFLAYAIFKERGLDVLPVASIDNDWGITPQTLDAAIGKLAEAKRRVAFVYLVPTHNNPTGTTYSPKKRLELIEVSDAACEILNHRSTTQQTPCMTLPFHLYNSKFTQQLTQPVCRFTSYS